MEQLTIARKSEVELVDKASDSFLPVLFRTMNEIFFGEELPDCRIKWSERVGTGKHYHKLSDFTVFEDAHFSPVIRLSKSLLTEYPVNKIAETLFYAMIHIWLWKRKLPWGQTKEFFEKARAFEYEKIDETLQSAMKAAA